MERISDLEHRIKALLRNNNISIKVKENVLFIEMYNKPIYEIVFDNFNLICIGVTLDYYTSIKEILQKHKEIIETCLLIDENVEKQLIELVKEYI